MKIKLNTDFQFIRKYIAAFNLLIFIGSIILSYFVLISPLFKLVLKSEATRKEKSNDVENAKTNLKNYVWLKEEVPDFPSKVDLLDKIMTNQSDAEQLLVQIQNIAKKSNLFMTSIAPQSTLGQMTVSLSGTKKNFYNFLDKMEKNQLIIDIITISLSGDDTAASVDLRIKIPSGVN